MAKKKVKVVKKKAEDTPKVINPNRIGELLQQYSAPRYNVVNGMPSIDPEGDRVSNFPLTVDRATAFLELMASAQRKFQKAHVDKIARSLNEGDHVRTDPIKFNVKGELADGQHVCRAVIKSGKTACVEILLNRPVDEVYNYDLGKVRSAFDVAKIEGLKNGKEAMALARTLIQERERTRSKIPHKEKIDLIRKDAQIQKSVNFAYKATNGIRGHTAVSYAAAHYWLISCGNPASEVEEFLNQVARGNDGNVRSPISIAKSWFANAKRRSNEMKSVILAKAWNLHAEGKEAAFIRSPSSYKPYLSDLKIVVVQLEEAGA